MTDFQMRGRKRTRKLLELVHIYLPPELWRQILGRLPPKTLMKFRCVCKDWRSLIDDPDFISMHLNLYRNNHRKAKLLTMDWVEWEAEVSSARVKFRLRQRDTLRNSGKLFEYWGPYVSHFSSLINGVSLLSISDELILFNPSIRKFLRLPSCPLSYKRFSDERILGYAPSSNDYKVVEIETVAFNWSERLDATAVDTVVAIYSLRDHRWREYMMQVRKWCIRLWDLASHVYFQGAVYWCPWQIRENAEDTALLSFDFDSEVFRYLKLPNVEEGMFVFLFVFGGSLALFGISSVRSCIWVLENNAGIDSNESWRPCWNRDTSLDVYDFFEDFSHDPYRITYIEDTGVLLLGRSWELVAYNMRSNQIGYLTDTIIFSHADTYVESLVLHKGYEDAGQQYEIGQHYEIVDYVG